MATFSSPVWILNTLYIVCIICINGQSYNPPHSNNDGRDTNSGSSSTSSYSQHDGDTAIMGFLVITLCCLFGCCINICLRSSRRRRRRRMRAINLNQSGIQLFRINDESLDEFEENEEEISCNEGGILASADDTGTLINLDEEYKDKDLEETNIDIEAIEAIKREKKICVICHDELSGNVRILDCNHIFCVDCIKQWEKEENVNVQFVDNQHVQKICRKKTEKEERLQLQQQLQQLQLQLQQQRRMTRYHRHNHRNYRRNDRGQRLVVITQNRNNGTRNVRILRRNSSDLNVTMPVHAFLL